MSTEISGYQDQIAALEERRDALEAEVDALEEVVAKLESEGLRPLVDRLRSQIGSIKKLVVAMATAIDELTEGGSSATVKKRVKAAVEKLPE